MTIFGEDQLRIWQDIFDSFKLDELDPDCDECDPQTAAEAHIEACDEALFGEEDGPGAESPSLGPYCGCVTCVVREVLYAGFGAVLHGRTHRDPVRDALQREFDHGIPTEGAAENAYGYGPQLDLDLGIDR